MELVDESGAPRGQRRFFLFNPPVVNEPLGIRASYVKQAVMLASDLVRASVPTIVFGQSRNSVEVMLRYLRDAVAIREGGGRGVEPDRIMAYRGAICPISVAISSDVFATEKSFASWPRTLSSWESTSVSSTP